MPKSCHAGAARGWWSGANTLPTSSGMPTVIGITGANQYPDSVTGMPEFLRLAWLPAHMVPTGPGGSLPETPQVISSTRLFTAPDLHRNLNRFHAEMD